MTDLQMLAIDTLVPHPDNPRLQLREDVVERIAGEIGRYGFGQEHALLVRPIGADTRRILQGFGDLESSQRYEILSGHHRVEAAKRAGLDKVPCWVKDLDDDEAFMQLVLCNEQSELSKIERALHVYRYGERGERGRGKKGGLSEYARRIDPERADKLIRRVQEQYTVGELIENARASAHFTDLIERDPYSHLLEIARVKQESVQSELVNRLVISFSSEKPWTAADTAHYVSTVCEFDIPDHHAYWLPVASVTGHFLATREFSPKTVARLVAAADQTFEWIAANGAPADEAAFRAWLTDNSGGKSWQPRAIAEYLAQLIAGQFIVKGWHHGDWREHIGTLENGSVSLLLTDPPYGMGYQSDRRVDRRKERKHELIAGDSGDASAEVTVMLEVFEAKLADDAHVLVFCGWAGEPEMRDAIVKAGYTIRGSLIWDKQARGMGDHETTFAPSHERIIHAVKGSPMLYRRAADLLSHPRCDSTRHPTEKPVSLLRELIEAATAEGQLVADPFGGVASTLEAAKASGRRWWGCELEEKYWQAGEERLS